MSWSPLSLLPDFFLRVPSGGREGSVVVVVFFSLSLKLKPSSFRLRENTTSVVGVHDPVW